MTLSHEVGHNLGLNHYGTAEPNSKANFMTVATRYAPGFFAFQWSAMHDTLEARVRAGDPGVSAQ
ncbi:hypothetical protein D3C84_1294800 [compost metagenome]